MGSGGINREYSRDGMSVTPVSLVDVTPVLQMAVLPSGWPSDERFELGKDDVWRWFPRGCLGHLADAVKWHRRRGCLRVWSPSGLDELYMAELIPPRVPESPGERAARTDLPVILEPPRSTGGPRRVLRFGRAGTNHQFGIPEDRNSAGETSATDPPFSPGGGLS
jgi:hypothetical protein